MKEKLEEKLLTLETELQRGNQLQQQQQQQLAQTIATCQQIAGAIQVCKDLLKESETNESKD